jgi:hypothetical protein
VQLIQKLRSHTEKGVIGPNPSNETLGRDQLSRGLIHSHEMSVVWHEEQQLASQRRNPISPSSQAAGVELNDVDGVRRSRSQRVRDRSRSLVGVENGCAQRNLEVDCPSFGPAGSAISGKRLEPVMLRLAPGSENHTVPIIYDKINVGYG